MGTKIEKSEETYTVTLVVTKNIKRYTEDSYDKVTQVVDIEKVPLADIAIAGSEWETLKAKVHSHVDLVG